MFKVHYYTHFLIFCIFFSSSSTKANQAEVLAALAGKADAMVILDGGDISQLVPLKSTGFVATPAVTGTPRSAWWIGSAETTGTIFRVDLTNVHYPSESHRRTYQNGNWTGWARLATTTPPTEYPLPLAAGYVVAYGQACDYSVAQDKLVVVHVSVARQDGANLNGVLTLATLPAGVRPAKAVVSAAAFGIYLKADTNGAITCHAPGTYDSIGGTLVFYAAA